MKDTGFTITNPEYTVQNGLERRESSGSGCETPAKYNTIVALVGHKPKTLSPLEKSKLSVSE